MYKLQDWQKVILMNYSYVPVSNIAKVLNTSEEIIEKNAKKLGLDCFKFNGDWIKKGFVTIIRNNWDLLTESQIVTLLGISEKEYKTLLVEYDFLDVKLDLKPEVKAPIYIENDIDCETEKVNRLVNEVYIEPKIKPFDFYSTGILKNEQDLEYTITDRFTSNYCAKYTDILLDDDIPDYNEEYLQRLKATGVTGLWFSETLKNLAEFPFDTTYSPDYQIRVKNLKTLTERCNKYGIGIYLYLNEPRSMPSKFFEKYPHLKGQKVNDNEYCMCTSVKEVQEYLYNAVYSLCKSVPLLKAIFTITMSENPTHCYSKQWIVGKNKYTECPHCVNKKPYEVAVNVNNIMCKAVKDANKDISFIANLWGWSNYWGWSDEEVTEAIKLLDKDVDVLCVSEFDKEFTRGGVTSKVVDYSISVIGPSDLTVKCLTLAKQLGHRTWAKVQVNNSWECSAVPYLPVYDLMIEHINNLKTLGITGIMLGWSLGGYPGGALSACCSACSKKEFNLEEYLEKVYKNQSDVVIKSMKKFSSAYREYPFGVSVLYFGAQTLGPANLWSLQKDTRKSTMVCYSFDDYENWSEPYGLDVYINQLTKLCTLWKDGLNVIKDVSGNEFFEEYKTVSYVSYIHLNSALLHAEFVKYKGELVKNKEKLLHILHEEYENTTNLYKYFSLDAKVGFEMTNHYYYTPSLLILKLMNVKNMIEQLNNQ